MRARRALRFATSVVCGVLLLALMGVTVVDVIGRYQFDNPLETGSELTQLLLMSVIFSGLPAVCLDDSHIAVDLITARLTGAAATVQLFLARIVSAAVLGVIAWQLWEHSLGLFEVNRITQEYRGLSGEFLRWPTGYFAQGAAIITGVSAALTLALAGLGLSKGGERA